MRRSRVIQASVAAASIAAASLAFSTSGVQVGALSDPMEFAAALLGSHEVPVAGDPDGTGSAIVFIDPVTDEICWDIVATGIASVTAAHIHEGAPGVAGPVRVDFGGSFSGCLTDATYADLIYNNPQNFYVNVHTDGFIGGAIRGQLAPSGSGPLAFNALPNPVRVYDSRSLTPIAPNETRTILMVEGKDGAGVTLPAVPVGAYSAQVIITVTVTNAGGYLTAHAAGTPVPSTSVINWSSANQNIAVGTVVPIDETGRLAITAGPTSMTHLIIDVIGYFSCVCVI